MYERKRTFIWNSIDSINKDRRVEEGFTDLIDED